MMKNNRFKQTKQTKQKKQTKQTKQTKHKRRMQYGGKKYNYLNYSTILKTDAPHKTVVIPGYAEISDMIKEYTDSVSIQNQLDAGIKSKNVVVYDSCERPKPDTPDTSIILLRKSGLMSFATSSIDCDDETYLTLASHNFRIFIIHILKWNPFLPNLRPKPKDTPNSQYYGTSPHMYNQSQQFSYLFKQKSWWDSQQWWTSSESLLPTYASLVPREQEQEPSPEFLSTSWHLFHPPPEPISPEKETIRVLQIQVDGLNRRVSDLTKENQELMKRIEELELETKKDR
jgi:hypothetical protein